MIISVAGKALDNAHHDKSPEKEVIERIFTTVRTIYSKPINNCNTQCDWI